MFGAKKVAPRCYEVHLANQDQPDLVIADEFFQTNARVNPCRMYFKVGMTPVAMYLASDVVSVYAQQSEACL